MASAVLRKELQATGCESLRAIAAGLEERGIPAARGGKWSAVQVSRLLEAAAARRSDLGDAAGSDLRFETLAEIIGLSLTRGRLTT
jgi:hypothetical protein